MSNNGNPAWDASGVSVIIPARNESAALQDLLPKVLAQVPAMQVFLVDDGSTDDTAEVCARFGVNRISHPYGKGNGAAIKSGVRAATGEILVMMDGDGQHDPADIPRLVAEIRAGYDMVVGARGSDSQASTARRGANGVYNLFAGWMVGQKVADLTSGFRAVRVEKMREFLYLLPNGFSYPTTITMAFFRAGYSVRYLPISAAARVGKSHIRLFHDGLRFLLIIFRIGTLYSPLKIFFPASMAVFGLGLAYYGYTYSAFGRFTNMSATLFISALQIFLMGLISEQITALQYSRK